MPFIHDIYEFKKSFRNIEKITLKCACLNNGIFQNYCHIYILINYLPGCHDGDTATFCMCYGNKSVCFVH